MGEKDESDVVQARTVSREELYALVWQTPMYRLGEQLGISGNGLTKICDRLNVPYPARGYWAKKAVGKAGKAPKLPPGAEGVPKQVSIQPTAPKLKPTEDEAAASHVAVAKAEGSSVPETLAHPHRIVRDWMDEHKRHQKEKAEENKRRRRQGREWGLREISDLTERDIYRFRVSSAIFSAIEKAGGRIKDAPVDGKVTFQAHGHDVECSIVEKLCKPLMKPTGDAAKWTAFPNYRLNSFHCTGFLRVKITSYLGRTAPDWIETRQKKIGDWLPEIVGSIMSAGITLNERERQRQEDHRRRLEEEARRLEIQQQRARDEERWKRFRAAAIDWDECKKLEAFAAVLRERLGTEGDQEFGDRSLSQWLEWATEKMASLDPLRRDLRQIFVVRLTPW